MDKTTIYQRVTDSILQAVANSPGDVVMPWHRPAGSNSMIPLNATTKNAYRGVNIIMLWMAADIARHPTGAWASYKQWQAAGAQVRKGERATPIIFYRQYDVDPTGESDDGKRRVARTSLVFNAAQVDGFDADVALPDYGPLTVTDRFQKFVDCIGADIKHEGTRAFYSTATDSITMPPMSLFHDTPTMPRAEGYMATLAHETAHYSGHSSRLNRQLRNKFGSFEHAAEEVIAEISASFICARLGLSSEPRIDHAQYIAHYMSMMRADPRAIFKCAAEAARATDYLFAFSEPAEDADDGELDIAA